MTEHGVVEQWRGKAIVGRDGERIGELQEIYLHEETAEVRFASVRMGLLGMDSAFVPLVDAVATGDHVRVPYATDEVRAAPNVDSELVLSIEEESRLNRHYGLTPALGAGGTRGAADGGSIARWSGRDVFDANDERIGELEELYLEDDTAEVRFGSVPTGLLGRRQCLIPLIEAVAASDHLRVAYTKDDIKAAPRVEPRGKLTAQDEALLDRHYGLEPVAAMPQAPGDSWGSDAGPEPVSEPPETVPSESEATTAGRSIVGGGPVEGGPVAPREGAPVATETTGGAQRSPQAAPGDSRARGTLVRAIDQRIEQHLRTALEERQALVGGVQADELERRVAALLDEREALNDGCRKELEGRVVALLDEREALNDRRVQELEQRVVALLDEREALSGGRVQELERRVVALEREIEVATQQLDSWET